MDFSTSQRWAVGAVQDGDLADLAVVVAQRGGRFDDFEQAGAVADGDADLLALGGWDGMGSLDEVAAAAADGDEADALLVEALEAGVGGEAAVEDEEAELEAAGMGEVEELEDGGRAGLAADGGVGTEQEAGVGILGEGGGEAGEGATAGGGPVFFESRIVAPMGQGGEVKVGGVGDEGARGEDAGELGEQALVHGAGGAVGVGGEPGGLGQDVEADEEAGATVHAPDVVGTVAADVRELEGEEGEDGLEGGEGAGARVAGEADGLVDAVAADEGEEAEDAGGTFGLEECGGARGEDSSPFVKAKRAIKRGSYSQWTWRDLTRGKTRVIPKMALEAPPRFPWRSACCQAPAVRGGPPNPLPQPSKRFARREGSPCSQGESQGRLPTSCQASQKTVPGEGQAADCFTACSGSKSVPLANMAQATASSRSATGVSTKFRTIWAVAAMAVEWSRRSSALHDC